MAVQSFKVIRYIEDADGNAITSGAHSPIAFRDADQTISWIEGTHISGGLWEFNLPSGIACGWEVGVETSAGTYTRDAYLSGTVSGNNRGASLAPIGEVAT